MQFLEKFELTKLKLRNYKIKGTKNNSPNKEDNENVQLAMIGHTKPKSTKICRLVLFQTSFGVKEKERVDNKGKFLHKFRKPFN